MKKKQGNKYAHLCGDNNKPNLSNEKRAPGCLVYIGDYMDYTTQLYRDYNKPLQGSLVNNQDSMESKFLFFVFFSRGSVIEPLCSTTNSCW